MAFSLRITFSKRTWCAWASIVHANRVSWRTQFFAGLILLRLPLFFKTNFFRCSCRLTHWQRVDWVICKWFAVCCCVEELSMCHEITLSLNVVSWTWHVFLNVEGCFGLMALESLTWLVCSLVGPLALLLDTLIPWLIPALLKFFKCLGGGFGGPAGISCFFFFFFLSFVTGQGLVPCFVIDGRARPPGHRVPWSGKTAPSYLHGTRESNQAGQ